MICRQANSSSETSTCPRKSKVIWPQFADLSRLSTLSLSSVSCNGESG